MGGGNARERTWRILFQDGSWLLLEALDLGVGGLPLPAEIRAREKRHTNDWDRVPFRRERTEIGRGPIANGALVRSFPCNSGEKIHLGVLVWFRSARCGGRFSPSASLEVVTEGEKKYMRGLENMGNSAVGYSHDSASVCIRRDIGEPSRGKSGCSCDGRYVHSTRLGTCDSSGTCGTVRERAVLFGNVRYYSGT